MKDKIASIVGLLVLLVGAGGVYHLFTHAPADAEDAEETLEPVVPVSIGQIERRTLHGYEVVYGRIEPAPQDGDRPAARSVLRPAVDGVVTRVACHPGSSVAAGDVLLELDARLADNALRQRRQALTLARQTFERQQQLRRIEGTSEQAFQEAEDALRQAETQVAAAEVLRGYHTLRAPIAGTITMLTVTVGQAVTAGQSLATILDAQRRVLVAEVPTGAATRVRVGQAVAVSQDAATWVPVGTLDYVAPEVDPRSGTRIVRAPLAESASWPAGQLVQARITRETRADCLAAPATALVTGPEGETTLALVRGERARQVSVTVGLREGAWVEVTGPDLSDGAAIVTEGAYGLPDETRITAAGHD